jgi:post-segregation antitoxin (ccd killing protein)
LNAELLTYLLTKQTTSVNFILENFMQSVNVRISSQSYQILKTLAQDNSQTMQSLIDQALEDLRRRKILEATNEAFSTLKANQDLWQEEIAERQVWENTLSDGVENE